MRQKRRREGGWWYLVITFPGRKPRQKPSRRSTAILEGTEDVPYPYSEIDGTGIPVDEEDEHDGGLLERGPSLDTKGKGRDDYAISPPVPLSPLLSPRPFDGDERTPLLH